MTDKPLTAMGRRELLDLIKELTEQRDTARSVVHEVADVLDPNGDHCRNNLKPGSLESTVKYVCRKLDEYEDAEYDSVRRLVELTNACVTTYEGQVPRWKCLLCERVTLKDEHVQPMHSPECLLYDEWDR